MSNVIRFPEPEKIEEEACDWIARLDGDDLSESEVESLKQWLQQDASHEVALLEMANLLDQMTVVSSLNKLLPLSEVAMDVSEPTGTRSGNAAIGLAASVVIGVAVFVAMDWIRQPVKMTANYQTRVGEIRDVQIGDGSTITLNSDSNVKVNLSEMERRVFLNQGEAMFDVQHDNTRPFVVEANGYEVKAVGTAFNVSFAEGELEVTVTEGVVEVTPIPGNQQVEGFKRYDRSLPETRNNRLLVGESMIITDSEVVTQSFQQEDVDARLSWRNGELVFRGETLEYVIAEVSRYSEVSLEINDDSIRHIPVGGVFKVGEVADLVDTLEHGFGITAERRSKNNIVLHRDPNTRE